MTQALHLAIVAVAAEIGAASGRAAFEAIAFEGEDRRPAHDERSADDVIDSLIASCGALPRSPALIVLGSAGAVLAQARANAQMAASLPDALRLADAIASRPCVIAALEQGADAIDGVALLVQKDAAAALAVIESVSAPRNGGAPRARAGGHLELVDPGASIPAADACGTGFSLGTLPPGLHGAMRELAALAKTAMLVAAGIVPVWPQNVPEPHGGWCPGQIQPWPPDRHDGRRRALLWTHAETTAATALADARRCVHAQTRFAERPPLLVPTATADPAALAVVLEAIERGDDLLAISRTALEAYRDRCQLPLAACMVAVDVDQLRADVAFFRNLISGAADLGRKWCTPSGSVLTARPARGRVAFVYPGYASAYVGAGALLKYLDPQLEDRLLARFGDASWRFLHADDLYPRREVSARDERQSGAFASDVRALCETTIALSAIWTDLVRHRLKLEPDLAFGYSIGEVAMLFALGIWNGFEDYAAALDRSALFERRLGGPMETVRAFWPSIGLPAKASAWAAFIARAPVARLAEIVAREPGAMITLINTPSEAVVSGHPEALARVRAALDDMVLELPVVLPLHCAAIAGERATLRLLHDRDTAACDRPVIYMSADCGPVEVTRAALREAITAGFTEPVDFPCLVRQAYEDGARIFVETGPRRICSTWIDDILGPRPHAAVPIDVRGLQSHASFVRACAQLIAHRAAIDLDVFLQVPSGSAHQPARAAPLALKARHNDKELAETDPVFALLRREIAYSIGCMPDIVDPNTSIFKLGLDSVVVVGLAAKIERSTGVRLELVDLLQVETIADIAQLINQRRLLASILASPDKMSSVDSQASVRI
jgi:PfaB family protein